MRLKVCKNCGRVFQTETDHYEVYMCPECSKQINKDRVKQEKTCIICGATFTGYIGSLYCENCRAKVIEENNRAYKKMGPRRPLGSIDYCQKCGAEYVVNSGKQKYCPECAAEAVRENIRKHNREYNRKNKDHLKENKVKMKADGYVCVICGKPFDKKSTTVTCSPECAKELKRRRQAESDLKRGKRKTPLDQVKKSTKPKSGIVGITWHQGKWQVVYKKHYIGIFENIEEAKEALEDYKKEFGTEK